MDRARFPYARRHDDASAAVRRRRIDRRLDVAPFKRRFAFRRLLRFQAQQQIRARPLRVVVANRLAQIVGERAIAVFGEPRHRAAARERHRAVRVAAQEVALEGRERAAGCLARRAIQPAAIGPLHERVADQRRGGGFEIVTLASRLVCHLPPCAGLVLPRFERAGKTLEAAHQRVAPLDVFRNVVERLGHRRREPAERAAPGVRALARRLVRPDLLLRLVPAVAVEPRRRVVGVAHHDLELVEDVGKRLGAFLAL